MKNIYLTITEGRIVRDILRLGTLDALLSFNDVRVIILTPAYRVPEFLDEFDKERVVIRPQWLFTPSKMLTGMTLLERTKLRAFHSFSLWERLKKAFYPNEVRYLEIFREYPPSLVVSTNIDNINDLPVIRAARQVGARTLGLVRSWDNVLKGLVVRPDEVAVWNKINKREVADLERYPESAIHITGPVQFDPYFTPGIIRSRKEFLSSLGLDPVKKLIVLATIGTFGKNDDETFLLRVLMEYMRRDEFIAPVQILCRLHPATPLSHFWRFMDAEGVRFSFIDKAIPTLGWTMTFADVVEVANILAQADVVVSPGSTITLEAAIFDRPIVVPIFNDFQPERARAYYNSRVLSRHYKPIVERGLVPFVHNTEELVRWINRFLSDPALFQAEREQLVSDYVQFTDGKSAQRLAQLLYSRSGGNS